MTIKYPEYDNSIVSVSNSILNYYGAAGHHATLPLLDDILKKDYKNVVLMVFDGLGVQILEDDLPKDCFFRKHMISELSSVYPCTTTAALTSILSGLTPAEHGWAGWSCYFKETGTCIDLFSGNISGIAEGVKAAPEHIPYKYLGYKDIFKKISTAANGSVKTCVVSPFSEYFANTCEGICEHIERLCKADGRKFIYAYHYQPDHDIHDFGTTADCIKTMAADYDRQIDELAGKVEDTVFIIIADHGLIDITMKCIEDYPKIYECLKLPVSVEPRCCSLFVKEEYKSVFKERFISEFGDKFILFSHDEFLEKGLLGNGKQHYKINDFIGDYIAVAVSDIALWNKDNHGEYSDFKAAHAGLCKEEMTVPFIVVERK